MSRRDYIEGEDMASNGMLLNEVEDLKEQIRALEAEIDYIRRHYKRRRC